MPTKKRPPKKPVARKKPLAPQRVEVKIPAAKLREALGALRHATSKDETRAHLHCVWIQALSPERVYAFATSGHWLLCMRLPEAVPGRALGSICIPVADVKRTLALADAAGDAVVYQQGRTTIVDFPTTSLKCVASEMPPPPVASLIPKKTAPLHPDLSIGTEFYRAFCVACDGVAKERGKTRCIGVRVRGGGVGPLDGMIAVCPEIPELIALIMPRRAEPDDVHASWVKFFAEAKPAKAQPKAA